MVRRFKSKKKVKFRYRFFLFLTIMISAFLGIFNVLYKNFSKHIDNEKFINSLINYNLNIAEENNILYDVISLNSTSFLLKYTLGVDLEEDTSEEVVGLEASYIEDPYENKINDPIIYLYNTHQTEGYQKSNNATYNITPSVLMASYILRESLNDLGLPTLVETNDITEILRIHNWQYKYSYSASKILLEDAKSKNKNLTYFIDLHRDSMNHDVTTTSINGKNYAKILFVIGKDYVNYQENLAFAEKINEKIKANYPTLCRGISLKGGSGVNGIYNQDISPRAILIELGGQYNNINEVNNTLEILAKALFEVIEEDS